MNVRYFSDVSWLWYDQLTDKYHPRHIIRIDPHEASLLWKYVKITFKNVIEIGRMFGGSTVLILEALLPSNRKVYSIDQVDNIKNECKNYFLNNLNRVDLINMSSQEAYKKIKFNTTDCIFIDGDHTYDGVKLDTELYWNFLDVNGYIIYHDHLHPKTSINMHGIEPCDVYKFCHEWASKGKMDLIEQTHSMAVFKKIK